MAITIQKLPIVKQTLGVSRSTFYQQISEGLITKPVRIGLRAVGWPSNEIEAILKARISGKTSDQIKALVKELERLRSVSEV